MNQPESTWFYEAVGIAVLVLIGSALFALAALGTLIWSLW